MTKKVVIFGSGNAAIVLLNEILKLSNFNVIGFADSKHKKGKIIIKINNKKYSIIGSIEEFAKKRDLSGIVGVGSNYRRMEIVNKINKINKSFKWEKVISRNAIVEKKLLIGEGSVILSGAFINFGTKIGKHCRINSSSSIDHDNFFDDFSSCGPGVITGGNVTVGNKSFIGIGSVVKQKVKIGKNTVIGGNSFVNKNCNANSLYYGSPIKKIRKRRQNESYL